MLEERAARPRYTEGGERVVIVCDLEWHALGVLSVRFAESAP